MAATIDNSATIPSHIPADAVYDFDFYGDPSMGDKLHESLEVLHREAPDMFYTPRNGGHWVATRFDVIGQITQDPEHFSVREMQIPRVPTPPVFIPLSLDPPDNFPYRQALMPIFSPKSVKAMEAKIEHWAEKIVADVAAKGECDFMHDVAELFPVSVFMELMGMDLERLREFRELAFQFFGNQNNAEKLAELQMAIIGVMTEYIEEKRQNPDGKLISQLLETQINGRPITMEELQNMCLLLFVGGMDTVANCLGFTFSHLANDPDLQQRLVNEPEKINTFVEEAVRLYGVINTPRIVAKDCEKFGLRFKKDEMVLCMLPLGGRDDRVNKNAQVLDIDRPKSDYITFSKGPHLCVGHFLARAEMRAMVSAWLAKIPSFTAPKGGQQNYRASTALTLIDLPLQWS